MRTIRRHVTGALTAAAAALLVAACGSGTPGQSADEEDAGEDGAVVLQMWQDKFSDADNAWYKEKVEAFNAAHDDVQIKLTVVPGDAWDQKMKAAQAAGTAPDLYTLNYSEVLPRARNGELAPIGDVIAPERWEDLEERFLDAVTEEGERYAYPMLYEPSSLLFYRADLFEAAGLDPDAPPESWDDLISTATALKAAHPDVVPFQTAQNGVELSWTTWGLQVNATGHLPISDDWSTSLASDEGYLALLETYQRLAEDGLIARQALSPYGDAAPLGEGKLAMQASGSWAISQLLLDYPDIIDDLRVAPLPSLDGDLTKPTGTLGGWSLGVDAKSDHPEEAAQAISWLLAEDVDVVLDYFTDTNFTKFSPRISVAAAIAEEDTSVNPWLDVMTERVVPYQVLEPTYDWAVSLAFGTAMEKALQGQDIEEALTTADAEITKAITDLDLAARAGS
ncbi:ABC transporter substrate-binding protein [Jiangella alba]|uniref:Carbohydrate ABC transporter substrate-binding protein, CUT1 family n=1 Tax=Jiangella alba TaxID=561176 RepID=A0A1H5JIY3_9ACTN|nr:sugar ABC transporter substrate-binding protein [Jiangella alba]SEE52420.1 carbohydrate ABC transporter substrate-binding protein, CUT1 family [Jiangella alba]